MKSALAKILSNPYLLILLTAVLKIPLFFTKHIQEDSFITWRVARNLLNYGVVGFNGEERLSASTTHLYVLVSAFFQLIFGEGFIYPLLIFSSVLFAIGSYWLAKILFRKDVFSRGFFVLFLNMTPPALTASCIGMEYGILFFLYCGLIYFGIKKEKAWAYFIFPVLLLWMRIDTVIFLGVFFFADLILKRSLNVLYILGGILGVVSVVSFNYFYFGEFFNHTITAKNIAYKNLLTNNSTEYFLYQWAYYGGLIKKYSLYTFLLWVSYLIFLGWILFKVVREPSRSFRTAKVILISAVVFALVKITVFASFKAYFDWYYWLPRVFLFVAILFYFLHFVQLRKRIFLPVLFLIFGGLYVFQFLQSYAIGYMEAGQRMQVADDINKDSTGIEHSIFLEPAGIIPFYTELYTYDEVGLVNKKITAEMLNDEDHWWINSVKKFRPDYILTVGRKPGDPKSFYTMKTADAAGFNKNYRLVKEYPIAKIHSEAPEILRWIYGIRSIGKDYYLYKTVK